MAEDPAVDSIEVDCLERADMSLPGTLDLEEAVARRLTVHDGPPWGLDRIDGVDDNSYDDGDLRGGGTGVRVYVVDTGIQGSHVDFGGRVVSGHTVRAAPQLPLATAHRARAIPAHKHPTHTSRPPITHTPPP